MFKNKMVFLFFIFFYFSKLASAACVSQNGGLPSVREIILGSRVDLGVYSLTFQPAGTPLYIESFSNAQMASLLGRTLETTVFQCDIGDENNIFELYYLPLNAANGVDNQNPMYNAGGIEYWAVQAPSLSFQIYLGMSKSVSEQYHNTINKKPIGYDIDPVNSNKINIKLKHFSGVSLEQARSNNVVTANGYNPPIAGFSRGIIGFSGPNINATPTNRTFPPAGTYLPIRMRGVGARIIATCGILSAQNTVYLGQVPATSVTSMSMTPIPFSFTLQCGANVPIKYGFAPGEENRAANETNYLLLNPSLGSTAKGVAIEILTEAGNRNQLLNLGAIGGSIPAVNSWTTVNTAGGTQTVNIPLKFFARYVPYGGVPITAGKANSQMTIMLNAN